MGLFEKAANALGIKTAEQKAAAEELAKQRKDRANELERERLGRLGLIDSPVASVTEPLHAANYAGTTPETKAYRPAGADQFSPFESGRKGNREMPPQDLEYYLERDKQAKEIAEKTKQERQRNAQLAGKLVDYFNSNKDQEYEPGKTFGKNLEKFAEKLISESDPDLLAAAEALYPQYVREQALFDAALEGYAIKQGDQKDFSSFADKAMVLSKIQKKESSALN